MKAVGKYRDAIKQEQEKTRKKNILLNHSGAMYTSHVALYLWLQGRILGGRASGKDGEGDEEINERLTS